MTVLAPERTDIRGFPLQYVKGVGPKVAPLFLNLGVATVGDFLDLAPRSYQDRRNIPPLAKLSSGDHVLCFGAIRGVHGPKGRPRVPVIKAEVTDASGSLMAVWFNQPYLKKVLTPGKQLILSGKLSYDAYFGERQLMVDDWEFYDAATDQGLSLGRVVPIYGLTQGLYQSRVRAVAREIISAHLGRLEDPLSPALRQNWNLPALAPAVENIHFPQSADAFRAARRRLAFDEFFYLQIALQCKRNEQAQVPKQTRFKIGGDLLDRFYEVLPFALTGAQRRVINEIHADMASNHIMNRLVQGDVGAGKTEVAIAAICVAIQSGYQAALMAPTEILAEQHFFKLWRYLAKLGIDCYFLAGKLSARKKKATIQDIQQGKPCVVVGTHALIQDKVFFSKLGLVIVDEQHRFGVKQRMTLQDKGYFPDVLLLTATPIPRSLSLTLYGDLDKSLLDEMPPGRQPVRTYWEPMRHRAKVYEFIRSRVRAAEQAFIVFPLVEESEKLNLRAATEAAQKFQDDVFPEYKVGLLHGRMKPNEKTAVMEEFRSGAIHILVSTTVIEVGIDVPQATVMVIEHAERFGLSQLHQLRGRIGRGRKQSFCFLLAEAKGQESRRRLKALVDTADGFRIAEVDLKLRGPGDFFGVRQSGIPGFKVADLIRDEKTLLEAKRCAQQILAAPLPPPIEKELLRRMGAFLGGTRLN